jgi:hypothetical protein
MSAPFFIPFNFQPASVSVKTASYTIPAGRYAYVVANVEGTGTFTIDAATALRSTQNSVLASDNLRTSTPASQQSSALYTSTSDASASAIGGAFNETTDQKTVVHGYWVPSGTIINGTGTWRAVVTEYNQLT